MLSYKWVKIANKYYEREKELREREGVSFQLSLENLLISQ